MLEKIYESNASNVSLATRDDDLWKVCPNERY